VITSAASSTLIAIRGDETLALAAENMLSASVGFGIHPGGESLDHINHVRRVTRARIDHLALATRCATTGLWPDAGADLASGRRFTEQMSEQLEWSETGENHYEARRDERMYVASRESDEDWCVVLFIGLTEDASPEDASAVVARCSAPTLEDAKQIAQQWELEREPR
jgi:hypothetical protein